MTRQLWRVLTAVAAIVALVIGSSACDTNEDGDGSAEPRLGTVSVEFADLEGHAGDQLAGVLLSDTAMGGTAVGGFAVTVDSDPFSDVQVLGNVDEEWGDADEDELWPWPTGEMTIPAGTYTLRLASGADYCCYSRWMPAATPGLRLCDVTVTTTGDDQVILITEIPELDRCGIDDEPAISEACLGDMEDAADVPDLEEDFKNEALWPTFTSCTSAEEWEAARIAAGIEPPFDVGHLEPECGMNPAVADSPLCATVAAARE